MASCVFGEWYFDETYATCMLEMAVDVLNMDETFQNKILKVHTLDLYVVDMNERVGDVTGKDEGSCQVVLCKYPSRHIASKGISNGRFIEKQDTANGLKMPTIPLCMREQYIENFEGLLVKI